MNRIKELRKEKGLTLRQLSDAVDIPASTLSRYEQTGKTARKPKFENLLKLAEFFEVAVGYVSGFSDKRKDLFYVKNGKEYFDSDYYEKNKDEIEKGNTEAKFYRTYNFLNHQFFQMYDEHENEKIINSIDDFSTKKEAVETLTRFFNTSLQSLNNDKRAIKTMNAIKALINNYYSRDYEGDFLDLDDLADLVADELKKD